MLVFAGSDKGGTGRSVTSCNIAYRLSLQGKDVAYLDFDFGSPTAGAIFEIAKVERGTSEGGLHSYVEGQIGEPHQVDVRGSSDRASLRTLHPKAGRLVLFPGDRGGAEFTSRPEKVTRCIELFRRLEQEFDVCVVDLSAGRSHAVQMVLHATARTESIQVVSRWLIYHRWTRQHIVAAHGLVFGDNGLLDAGVAVGHNRDTLYDSIRSVRTAVPDLKSSSATNRATQAKWLHTCDEELKRLARDHRLGQTMTLGSTPMEPVLQWREQVISDADVVGDIANPETVKAFEELARKLTDDETWEIL